VTDARMNWNDELGRTADCIAIERLGEQLTVREREHLAHCARCQSEMALWNEFNESEPRAEDEADVQAVVEELRRGKAGRGSNVVSIQSRRKSWMRSLAIAATLVIAVGAGYLVENREPSVNVAIGGDGAYRSAGIEVIGPKGDIATAPAELRWTAVAGAKQYDVAVLEVDKTILWHAVTTDTHVSLPSSVSEQCVPGKTILWQVKATRDSSVIAQSGVQRFRVKTQ